MDSKPSKSETENTPEGDADANLGESTDAETATVARSQSLTVVEQLLTELTLLVEAGSNSIPPQLDINNGTDSADINGHTESSDQPTLASKDENLNPTITTKPLKPSSSGVPSSSKLGSYLTSTPRWFGRFRKNFTVLNLFSDFARMIGLKQQQKKKRGVHFPSEVIIRAEERGEVSPDDKTIPIVNFPFSARTYSQKKSKAVVVYRGEDFRPRLLWIDDTTKCEVRCEKIITTCQCLNNEYQDPKKILKAKAKEARERRAKKGKTKQAKVPTFSKLTETFLAHVNTADLFLSGHKKQTLTTALDNVDGSEPFSMSSLLIKIQDAQATQESPRKSDTQSQNPVPEYEYEDELKPISKARLGRLATNIWIFANCVPLLFINEDKPSETLFRKLMEQFAALAMSAKDGTKPLIKNSVDFHNYAHEAMRVIRNLQLKIYLEGDTSVKEPLKLGSGLQLMRKTEPNRPEVNILIAKKLTREISSGGGGSFDANTEAEGDALLGTLEENLEWHNFASLSSQFKISSLKSLLTETLTLYDQAKRMIVFLVDDCKETTYDSKNDSDLLYRLSEMYNCVVKTVSKSHTQPSEQTNQELKAICEIMSKFILSLGSFVSATEHVMEKIMEVRDMIQLAYVYLQEDVKLDLNMLMPLDNPVKFGGSKHRLGKEQKCSKCYGGKSGKERQPSEPKYTGPDLFRVYYEDALNAPIIQAESYFFKLRESSHKKETIGASVMDVQIRFRNSETSIFLPSLQNKTSLACIVQNSWTSLPDEPIPEPVLKPILRLPNNSEPEIEPLQLEEVKPINSESDIKDEEEEDEPYAPRKGKDSVVLRRRDVDKARLKKLNQLNEEAEKDKGSRSGVGSKK